MKKNLESEYPLFIHLKFDHSHEINRQDHKRYRNVSQETKDSFVEMFENFTYLHRDHIKYAHNGERLGTYRGHNGTIWCLDVTYDTKLLLTGSADPSCFIWDVQYGTPLAKLECGSAVRILCKDD